MLISDFSVRRIVSSVIHERLQKHFKANQKTTSKEITTFTCRNVESINSKQFFLHAPIFTDGGRAAESPIVGDLRFGVEFRFLRATLKRLDRFLSNFVGLLGPSMSTGRAIFTRMRAAIRPLGRAEVRRNVADGSPRYRPRSLRRSTTAADIDAQFRGLRDDCTSNVPDEFRADPIPNKATTLSETVPIMASDTVKSDKSFSDADYRTIR